MASPTTPDATPSEGGASGLAGGLAGAKRTARHPPTPPVETDDVLVRMGATADDEATSTPPHPPSRPAPSAPSLLASLHPKRSPSQAPPDARPALTPPHPPTDTHQVLDAFDIAAGISEVTYDDTSTFEQRPPQRRAEGHALAWGGCGGALPAADREEARPHEPGGRAFAPTCVVGSRHLPAGAGAATPPGCAAAPDEIGRDEISGLSSLLRDGATSSAPRVAHGRAAAGAAADASPPAPRLVDVGTLPYETLECVFNHRDLWVSRSSLDPSAIRYDFEDRAEWSSLVTQRLSFSGRPRPFYTPRRLPAKPPEERVAALAAQAREELCCT